MTGLTAAAISGVDPAGGVSLVVGALAASRLPDVDTKWGLGKAHRSLPHSLLLAGGSVFVAAAVVFAWLYSGDGNEALGGSYSPQSITTELIGLGVIGFALGYLSHLLLDASTIHGIWLAVPGGRKIKPPYKYAVRTGGLRELAVTILMVAACALLLERAVGISIL